MQFGQTLEKMRAAGEETRLRVLALLSRSDLTVSELTRCLGQLQPRVSRHLRILVAAGLITPYQEGSWRFYRLAALPDWLGPLVTAVEGPELASDFAALEQVRAERAEKAAHFFAQNARDWDALRRLHTDDRLIEEALLDLAPGGVERFLDFGTGTGRMLIVFRGRYREALGFDTSPEMLSLARHKIEEEGLRNAAVRRRDILRAEKAESAESDLVCLHHVLHFLAEPGRAIASAADSLRPGGVLLIADFAPHDHEELRERYAHRRLGFGTAEIVGFAARAGLTLSDERTLVPETKGGLVSKIWRLDKPGGNRTRSRLEKAIV